MASLPVFSFTPSTTRVFATTEKNAGGSSKEEKGLFEWILGNLQKEDQFYETDPLLMKVEDKYGGNNSNPRTKNSVSVSQKKKEGGFGGLFAKK